MYLCFLIFNYSEDVPTSLDDARSSPLPSISKGARPAGVPNVPIVFIMGKKHLPFQYSEWTLPSIVLGWLKSSVGVKWSRLFSGDSGIFIEIWTHVSELIHLFRNSAKGVVGLGMDVYYRISEAPLFVKLYRSLSWIELKQPVWLYGL